jgi:Ca2+-binding RTX toxin-like protein
VRNTSSAVLGLARNWWGDASGPSGWSIGIGDSVSANVRFFPWTTDAGFSATAACTITGTNAPEVLNGTTGNDIMCGKGGNDTLNGLGGNDLIMGDGGNDVLVGGPGNDAILGTAGNDTLKGGAGLDSLQGGDGTDTCSDPNPFQFATCETGP